MLLLYFRQALSLLSRYPPPWPSRERKLNLCCIWLAKTLIFRDFAHFLKSGPGCQGFPARWRHGTCTIGKSVKNHWNKDPETLIWITWAKDILSQRGSRPTKWRMGAWAIWRPLVIGRRVLRTITGTSMHYISIIYQNTDLSSTCTPSYGFSWWRRCNPLKQTDNILYHKRREPKRIEQSWDIEEKPSQKYT